MIYISSYVNDAYGYTYHSVCLNCNIVYFIYHHATSCYFELILSDDGINLEFIRYENVLLRIPWYLAKKTQ